MIELTLIECSKCKYQMVLDDAYNGCMKCGHKDTIVKVIGRLNPSDWADKIVRQTTTK